MVGLAGVALLPWYGQESYMATDWLAQYPNLETGPALYQIIWGGRTWLILPLLPLIAIAVLWYARTALAVQQLTGPAVLGIGLLLLQGFAIIHSGPAWSWLAAVFPVDAKQSGMGYGALMLALSYLMLMSKGLAGKGYCRGDCFVMGSLTIVIALVGTFVFFPVLAILTSALRDNLGNFAPYALVEKIFDSNVWALGCILGRLNCGVAWNTLILGVSVGVATTLLGLAFALVAVRTPFPHKKLLRALTVLPIITPPFVIGLALILLFGRSGLVTSFLADAFDIPRSRWIYGFPGVFLAQVLAFTPIAFLVLIGVVQSIAPSLEEASQTLRASRWGTFKTITWPLMRPGVANAFLLGFIESLADFGNPLVLGGNFDVLSTKIFFAVVGAAHDQGRAATLALLLLGFTLAAFYAQNVWLGRRSYTTLTGKGDSGLPVALPTGVRIASYGLTIAWVIFTLAVYATILFSAFVKAVGRDHTFTLEHFWTGFAIEQTGRGMHFSGSAWNSFWTTLQISFISAPLTAALGLLTAYLLARQNFYGRRAFEFGTMLSFAIPGTVIGVSYILAFNTPPIELAGTGTILVLCFIFRNMPVGVRAGIAALAQIDKNLDEASLTLGGHTGTTLRRVIIPLLRPAIIAAMVYSFVRAITAVSAVIFLVTAQYNMATAYIVGRVEAGEFGLAIAYSTVLIAVMLVVIIAFQLLAGEARIGRRVPGQTKSGGANVVVGATTVRGPAS
ncbi:MAG TPA: iron ABC transporter permease [Hyphomicrobiaceae bacterium]|nr:iron ABC transporter permease [Hyphomicrobiaceae bacterium]